MSAYLGALTLLVGFVAGVLAMFWADVTRPRDAPALVEAVSAGGSLVVDEIVVPVLDVRLDRGAFVITARVSGPVPAVDTTDYVLMSGDGQVVFRSAAGVNRVRWPALRAGDRLTVHHQVYAEGLTAI